MEGFSARQAVQVEWRRGEGVAWIEGTVREVAGDRIRVALPEETADPSLPAVGEALQIWAPIPNGILMQPVRLVAIDALPTPSLLVVAAGGPERHQRRQFVRLAVGFRVQILPDQERRRPIGGHCLNLGGGGMSAFFPVALPDGSEHHLAWDLNGRLLRARARVIRQTESVRRGKGPDDERGYRIAFQFTEIAEPDRDAIIRFIFAEQMRLRRLGLL